MYSILYIFCSYKEVGAAIWILTYRLDLAWHISVVEETGQVGERKAKQKLVYVLLMNESLINSFCNSGISHSCFLLKAIVLGFWITAFTRRWNFLKFLWSGPIFDKKLTDSYYLGHPTPLGTEATLSAEYYSATISLFWCRRGKHHSSYSRNIT